MVMERMGASRTFGRLFGLLLVAETPLSLDDMAEVLQVSKPSVSTNTRMLEQSSLVRRVSVPGDRKHYYEIRPGAFERSLTARLPRLAEMVEILENGIETLPEGNTPARERLSEARDLYAFMSNHMNTVLSEWREQKGRKSLENGR